MVLRRVSVTTASQWKAGVEFWWVGRRKNLPALTPCQKYNGLVTGKTGGSFTSCVFSCLFARFVMQSTSGSSTKVLVRSLTLSASLFAESTSWIHCLLGLLASRAMNACMLWPVWVSGLSVTSLRSLLLLFVCLML
jgi:hypothetical protein